MTSDAPRLLLLTRPRPQAPAWLAKLAALGVPARALPLMEIAPPADGGAAAREAWALLSQARLAMFVSPNAVAGFFAQRPVGASWPAGTLAATVGPGSAQALLEAGVPAAQLLQPPADAASLDSEHLWPLLAGEDWQGRLALILRGEGGREWLAERLRERGARLQALSVYRRGCPQLDAAEQALLAQALARPEAHVWLFSSAEAITHLAALAERARPDQDWSAVRAIATHPRIAERAQALGLRHVVLARPEAGAVATAFVSA